MNEASDDTCERVSHATTGATHLGRVHLAGALRGQRPQHRGRRRLLGQLDALGRRDLLGLALVWTNGFVALFNMLPGLPLDGGFLVDSLVWKVTGSREQGMIAAGWCGRAVTVAVLVWVVVVPLARGQQPSLFTIIWGGFIGAFITIYVIGFIMDWLHTAAGGDTDLYNLPAFRIALSFQFIMAAIGVAFMLIERRKARRQQQQGQ